MKSSLVLDQLLRNGYFPTELPPAFITSQFADNITSIKGKFNAKFKSRCERYSKKEQGHSRRLLKIPNPISYYNLSKELADNWAAIDNLLSGSPLFNITEHIQTENRFIKIKFHEFEEKRMVLPATYKYILKTDISKFYPTIYTHSIPWAIEGKAQAKNNKKGKTLGNNLDFLARNCQDEQTLGLPIGPDTSRVMAEIIMVAIDKLAEERMHNEGIEFDGYRLIDDYFLCFNSLADAEKAFSIIAAVANDFELTINEQKTDIIPVHEWVEYLWKQELLEYSLPKEKQQFVLRNYINKAFSLAQSHRNSNVIKYAVKRSASWKVEKESWELYESFLIKSVMAFPMVFDDVASLLATYQELKYPISKYNIGKVCNQMIIESIPLGNHSEIAWSLWLLKMFGVDIDDDVSYEIGSIENSICAILILDLMDKGKAGGNLDTSKWESLLDQPDALASPMWLLVYESFVRGWLGANKKDAAYSSDIAESFSSMFKKKVSFYDSAIETNKVKFNDKAKLEEFYSS